MEQGIYALLRTRDITVSRYAEFSIPTYWIQDTGIVGKVGCMGSGQLLGLLHLHCARCVTRCNAGPFLCPTSCRFVKLLCVLHAATCCGSSQRLTQ